jgi:Domain of unknown function DUF29
MASANSVTDDRQSLYERDFYLRIEQQTSLLRAGRLEEMDVDNLLEELESLGRSEKTMPGRTKRSPQRSDPERIAGREVET